ncbi:hypothetical protein E2P64_06895 [Candidatus Bathyarchaeota archaeon]|nr:hypothetical protein E2P64_06895 [Candidatus Bathyarchaeota archaeon]
MKRDNLPDEVRDELLNISDAALTRISFSVPWQYGDSLAVTDEDGFPALPGLNKEDSTLTRETLQNLCFSKAQRNPHVNTAVRGESGRLTGFGFSVTSGEWEIQKVIDEIEKDPRNRLYYYLPKYMIRLIIEGELFLCLTCHDSGFVEIDFIDPSTIQSKSAGNDGIIYHPSKTLFPLMYNIRSNGKDFQQIPSIFCARYPDLLSVAKKDDSYDPKLQGKSKSRKQIFRQFNGYYKFIVSLEKGFLTKRSISHLRTTLEWVNHYENLKKYEIDHKKSAGAYLWIFRITDPKSFKIWLTLSDEDRAKTGILAKKTPGSSLVLPPGMEVEVVNPNLSPIRDEDTDVLGMISSGLNEPEDIMTGRASSSFASVKASRGPMSDRTADEASYFKNWYINDFWGSIFFLRSAVSKFPATFDVKEAIGWTQSQEPKFKTIKRRPEELIKISFPVSEMIDLESRARALLGVKHGPIAETLGISNETVAERMGFGGYEKERLKKATEDDKYPELVYETGSVDSEQIQEGAEGEPKKPTLKPKPKPTK